MLHPKYILLSCKYLLNTSVLGIPILFKEKLNNESLFLVLSYSPSNTTEKGISFFLK